VIVTSPEGVLAVRRRDKNPLGTFPSGEIEADESPVEAAVRETEEETGLEVVAGRILGRRIHPTTDRLLIYLAGRPAKQANIHAVAVVDKRELEEARWLSRTEVNDLMPDAYEPVLAYLDQDHRRPGA